MKYLFIDSVAGYSSTGKLVANECRKLQAEGHECLIAYGRKKNLVPELHTLRIGNQFDVLFHVALTRLFDRHGFASKRATKKFIKQIELYDPDIVCLHSLHGYHLNVEILFDYLRAANKKVLWTQHDCWNFTGHCAHFLRVNCQKWKTKCQRCPLKHSYPASLLVDNSSNNYMRKRSAFSGLSDVQIVTPSQWLAELVKESFLSSYPVEVRYNTIDHSVFKPSPSDFRQKNNLLGKFLVLGVASDWSEAKGLDIFIELSKMLDERFKIVLVGVTPKQIKILPAQIFAIQRTDSQKTLVEIYSAADVFLNPTLEDNYPTVNLEAQACGTPVITFDTGGCSETLNNKLNNKVLSDKTVQAAYHELLLRA